MLCLGKLPARPGAVKLAFHSYASPLRMQRPPDDFGVENLVTQPWGMLANDQVGDCYVAGCMHEIMLWCAGIDQPVEFSDSTAIGYYGEVTNYRPSAALPNGVNPTDLGTDVSKALRLRRIVGVPDDQGNRHKIGAYVALRPGSVTELLYASYYFDGVGIGVRMPRQWMEAFESGTRTWDAVDDPDYVGGHYISAVAWRNNMPTVITWGEKVQLTPAGYAQNCDEAYAYLSVDRLRHGVDRHGLNLATLRQDLQDLTRL